jgi:hypothetical protein
MNPNIHSSSHHILINELPMELRPHIIIHVALLLLDPLGLVLEDCVFVPALGQAVGRADEGVALEQLGLPVGRREFGFLLHFLLLLAFALLFYFLELAQEGLVVVVGV